MKENEQENMHFERIHLLYRGAPFAIPCLIIGFFSLFFTVRNILPAHYLLLWSGTFLLGLFWRLYLIFQFKKCDTKGSINADNIVKWEHYWLIMTAFTALSFVILIFFPFVQDSLISLLLITAVFMGISSGMAISSNASLAVVLTFLSITSIPLIFKSLYDAQPYYSLIAFITSFFYLVLIQLTQYSNQIIIENITLKQQSEHDSLVDSLTGLWNRRRLDLLIEQLLPLAQRGQKTFSIILLDIDHFKNFNDTYGHLEGDKILTQLGQCLLKITRKEDLAVRFGGEEFLIVLPDSGADSTQKMIERIMKHIHSEIKITLSAGIALFRPEMTFKQLIKQADDALYSAKHNGRDQFVIALNNKN